MLLKVKMQCMKIDDISTEEGDLEDCFYSC